MKRQNKILLILLFLLGIFTIPGKSQDSLSFYLEQAALNNPGLKARYFEYSAALEKVPQASSLPDPQLQLGYFLKPMELPGGNEVASIQLMQMFPWFGTLKAAKDEASKMALARLENFENARNELYFNVKTSYYKIYRTKEETSIAEKNLTILRTLEQLILVKFSSGTSNSSRAASNTTPNETLNSLLSGPSGNTMPGTGNTGTGNMNTSTSAGSMKSSGTMGNATGGSSMGTGNQGGLADLLRIQMEIKNLENRISLLKDQFVTDKTSFNRFLSRSPSSEVYTVDSLTQAPFPFDVQKLTDSLSSHPMVKMYQAEAEANAARKNMVDRMGYPMVGLGLNYAVIQPRTGNTSMMNGTDMIMPMASISLPIYRKKYKAMRREAEWMQEMAVESATDITNNLHADLQQSIQNLNDADRRIQLYANQVLLSEKSLDLLITTYSTGGTDISEVLRMEQQLLDYEFKLVEAIVDKNTSIAQLVYYSGNK